MDEVARYNKERWEELARARIGFSRPALDLDGESARMMLDPHGLFNGLVNNGFVIKGLWEDLSGDAAAPPGTWDHFKLIAPSFSLWAAYRPDVSR